MQKFLVIIKLSQDSRHDDVKMFHAKIQ